jgi:diacylglycerol kinase (ATP)
MFIVNPVAGSSKSHIIIPMIKKICGVAGLLFDIRISEKTGDVSSISRKAVSDGYTDIVAVGGDGTLSEVINGLFDKVGIKMMASAGVIPCGTGNDFARVAGVPMEIEGAIDAIVSGRKMLCDIGMVNGRLFLNVVSMGIDGQIVMDAGYIKKYLKGPKAYLISALKSIALFRPFDLKLRIVDGNDNVLEMKGRFTIVAVGNGRYFGGGMMITPRASIEDGLLDACIVRQIPRLKLIRFFPTVYKGAHTDLPYVEYIKCKKIEIYGEGKKIHVNSDGDIVGENIAEIHIIPRLLNLIV